MTAPTRPEPTPKQEPSNTSHADGQREIDPGTIGYQDTQPNPIRHGIHATRTAPNALEHFIVRNGPNGPVMPWVLLDTANGRRINSIDRSGQLVQGQRNQALLSDATAFLGTSNVSYFEYIPNAGLASTQGMASRGWQWKKNGQVIARFEVFDKTVNGVRSIVEKVHFVQAAFPTGAGIDVVFFPNIAQLPALTGQGVVQQTFNGTLTPL